jgi:hypothetical protein
VISAGAFGAKWNTWTVRAARSADFDYLSAEYLICLIRLLDIQPPASGGGRSGRLDRRAY